MRRPSRVGMDGEATVGTGAHCRVGGRGTQDGGRASRFCVAFFQRAGVERCMLWGRAFDGNGGLRATRCVSLLVGPLTHEPAAHHSIRWRPRTAANSAPRSIIAGDPPAAGTAALRVYMSVMASVHLSIHSLLTSPKGFVS